LRTSNDTFGKSYVLFLPWPAYRPDITKVKISARYDPANGHTLFVAPSTVTISAETPVWDGTTGDNPGFRPQPFGGGAQQPPPNFAQPIPIGGSRSSATPPAGVIQPGPMPLGAPVPGADGAMPLLPTAPVGVMPLAPGLQPIGMIAGQR
ncbi:MAG TPA: hypothetical protein VGZ47_02815, partial [Gemmataceae bacterium]|nr:hypothetical protein [Gemmataceae bacterium]